MTETFKKLRQLPMAERAAEIDRRESEILAKHPNARTESENRELRIFKKAQEKAEHQAAALQPLLVWIKSLEDRLAEVEKSGIKFMGVHQRALQKDYKRGCVVTSAGSAWVAVKDYPEGAPGRSDDWQLMVKAGRDAK